MNKILQILILCFPIIVEAQIKADLYPTEVTKVDYKESDRRLFEERQRLSANEERTESEEKRLEELFMQFDETKEYYGDIHGGGCSWYCCGSIDTVIASSSLKPQGKMRYDGRMAADDNFTTAWVEGVQGYGIGESLTYYFTSAPITEIIVMNGYVKTEKAYRENSRPKAIKVYHNGKFLTTLHLQDIRSIQTFKLGRQFGEFGEDNPQWTFKFEIADVYKGDKYDDTVITEIYFDGPCH